jgi:cellobiose-specific phosphotransferase system component IIA
MEETQTQTMSQELEQTCFQIIAHSGEAFSKILEAMKICRSQHYKKSQELMEEATQLLNKAHKYHTNLLIGEAQGNKIEYSVLLAHAQDHLMNSMLAKTLAEEMIEMYKELKGN